MAAFPDQVEVDLAERRQVAVGVVDRVDGLALVGVVDDLQAVVAPLRAGQRRRPDAVVLVVRLHAAVLGDHRDAAGEGLERPHRDAVGADVGTEDAVGVVVGSGSDRSEDVARHVGRARTGLLGCHAPILPR